RTPAVFFRCRRLHASASVFERKTFYDPAEHPKVNSPEPVERGLAASLWRRPQRWFLLGIPAGGLIALLIGVALTGGFVGAMKYTETDAFCTSCHEHQQTLQELKQSVHYSNVFGIQPR